MTESRKLTKGRAAVALVGVVGLLAGYAFFNGSASSVSSPASHFDGSSYDAAPAVDHGPETVDAIGKLPPPVVASGDASDAPATIAFKTANEKVGDFPATVSIKAGGESFEAKYTGMFIRTKSVLFVPVNLYSIASYVEHPRKGAPSDLLDSLMVDGPRKAYVLRFLKPLPGSQILAAIREEIDATFHDVDMKRLEKNIDQFVQIFAEGSSTGDEVYMAWLPGGRIYCSFKDKSELVMIAEDVPLARAIWRIWAGEQSGEEERLSLVERYAEHE